MRLSFSPIQKTAIPMSGTLNKSVLFSGQQPLDVSQRVLQTQYAIPGKGTFTGLDVLRMVQTALKQGTWEDKFFGIYMDAIFHGLPVTQVDDALRPLDALVDAGYLSWNQPDTAYRYKLTKKGHQALK